MLLTVAPLLTHNVFPAVWPGLVLALLVVTAAIAPRFGRPGGLGLLAVSVLWLLANQHMEGGTLVILSRNHGIVASDLAGVAGLALGGWLLVRGRL